MRRGFTLVEVLVALGIGALLLAILLPAFGSARESARRIACQSNLRQFYAALRGYADTQNGGVPPALPSVQARPAERVRFREVFDLIGDELDIPVHDWRSVSPYGEIPDAYSRVPAPWKCPSDDEFVSRWGFSYDYAFGSAISDSTGLVRPSLAREFAIWDEATPTEWGAMILMADGNPEAHKSETDRAYNRVRTDGSVKFDVLGR